MSEEIQTNKESQSSVNFETSTKGVVTYSIKVYDKDIDVAFKKAIEVSEKAQQYCNAKNPKII